MHPYSSIDTTAAWTKLRFILSVRSDFHIATFLTAIYIYIYIYIYQSVCTGRMQHKFNFKRSLTGLKTEISFSLTNCLMKAKEPSIPYYLHLAWRIIIGLISFVGVLELCEMQIASSRNWTRVDVTISHTYIHTYIHTPIYTYIHTRIHTYMFWKPLISF